MSSFVDDSAVDTSARCRGFFFTCNNWTDADKELLASIDCRYVVYGEEEGEKTHTPHLQGVIVYHSQRTVSSIRKKLKGFDVNVMRGTIDQAVEYVKKDCTGIFEKGDRPAGPAEKGIRGKAAVAARNKLLIDTPITTLMRNGDLAASQAPMIKKMKMIVASELGPYKPDHLRGIWLYGEPGTGKSRYAEETYPNAYMKEQNKWFDNYAGEKVILLDDLDSPALGHLLKRWCDRYRVSAETKFGKTELQHDWFVITSNYTPEDLWKDDKMMAMAVRRRCIFKHFGVASTFFNTPIHVDDFNKE